MNSCIPEHLISETANTPSASRLDHRVLDPVPLDGGEAPLSQRETADSESLGARRGGRGVACQEFFLAALKASIDYSYTERFLSIKAHR